MTIRRPAFLALLSVFLALPVLAADDADFYKRTGTHPPAGDFFIPVTARYIDNLGIGAGLGWQDRKTGFLVMAQLTYDRIDGATRTINIPRWCPYGDCDNLASGSRPRHATFSLPDRNEVGFSFTMGIPLRKVAHAAH